MKLLVLREAASMAKNVMNRDWQFVFGPQHQLVEFGGQRSDLQGTFQLNIARLRVPRHQRMLAIVLKISCSFPFSSLWTCRLESKQMKSLTRSNKTVNVFSKARIGIFIKKKPLVFLGKRSQFNVLECVFLSNIAAETLEQMDSVHFYGDLLSETLGESAPSSMNLHLKESALELPRTIVTDDGDVNNKVSIVNGRPPQKSRSDTGNRHHSRSVFHIRRPDMLHRRRKHDFSQWKMVIKRNRKLEVGPLLVVPSFVRLIFNPIAAGTTFTDSWRRINQSFW